MATRPSPFRVGARYRVRKAGKAGPDAFTVGEVLFYEGAGYSHYDGARVYAFRAPANTRPRYWMLWDDEPDTTVWTYFESL